MQSSKYANCWRADDATGIDGFLRAFSEVHRPYKVSDSHPHVCPCGKTVFTIALACAATKTTCADCGTPQDVVPSNLSWNDCVEESGDIEDYECDDCRHTEFHIAIGKSWLTNDGEPNATTWVNIGVRCCQCGLLSCVNDYCWPPLAADSFDPTWVRELAHESRPDLPWLADELGRCTSGTWTDACYIRFVDSSNANQPGSEWQFREVIELVHEKRGTLKLNVLTDDRIGGIEFYDRLFTYQLER